MIPPSCIHPRRTYPRIDVAANRIDLHQAWPINVATKNRRACRVAFALSTPKQSVLTQAGTNSVVYVCFGVVLPALLFGTQAVMAGVSYISRLRRIPDPIPILSRRVRLRHTQSSSSCSDVTPVQLTADVLC